MSIPTEREAAGKHTEHVRFHRDGAWWWLECVHCHDTSTIHRGFTDHLLWLDWTTQHSCLAAYYDEQDRAWVRELMESR